MQYNMELVESLRPLSKEEYKELEDDCRDHGVLDEIKVWNGYLVDGRHRLKIAEKNKLAVRKREMEFTSLEEARLWVIQNQLGRRNLTELEVQIARADLAKRRGVQAAADEYGVSVRTICRDKSTKDSFDQLNPEIREKCLSGEIINSRSDLERFGKLDDAEKQATQRRLVANPGTTFRDALPPKKKSVSQEDLDTINALKNIGHGVKRAIASGQLAIDSDSVKKLLKLSGEQQELLSVILEDPEVFNLKQGLMIFSGAVQPKTQLESIRIAQSSIRQLVDRIGERFCDLEALGVDTKLCRESLVALEKHVNALKGTE